MATTYVRCYTCRGMKQVQGIGGIIKDCWTCDGTGKIEAQEAIIVPAGNPHYEKATEALVTGASVVVSVEADITAMPVSVAVAMTEGSLPLVAVLDEVVQKDVCAELESKIDNVMVPDLSDSVPVMAGQLGVSPDLMLAVLDEPRMKPEEWRIRYKGIPGLLGANGVDEVMTKVERAGLRERYALLQPIAPRKVDLGAQQDTAVNSDAEYLKFKAKEDAKAKELEKKVVKK